MSPALLAALVYLAVSGSIALALLGTAAWFASGARQVRANRRRLQQRGL